MRHQMLDPQPAHDFIALFVQEQRLASRAPESLAVGVNIRRSEERRHLAVDQENRAFLSTQHQDSGNIYSIRVKSAVSRSVLYHYGGRPGSLRYDVHACRHEATSPVRDPTVAFS